MNTQRSVDPRTPCLIGVGHRTWHPEDVGPDGAPEPLAMWEEVARAAASDAGAAGAVERLERVQVVYCQSWQYDDAPARLAERLRCNPKSTLYSGIGGSIPQLLVGETANDISSGALDLALVVGAEALATKRRLKKEGRKPEWSYRPAEKRPFPYDIPFHPAEVSHSVFEAYLTFALFENARRGHLGTSLEEYRRTVGAELAAMTEVAAANPDAWFRVRRSAEELATATADNRMVAYPYTKLMVSIMDVDMAAALILASHRTADELGVPPEQRVYLRGWGYARDPDYVAERRDLWRSPAMRVAARAALAGGLGSPARGLGVDDVAHLDLYSCFGSSIEFAADALGFRLTGPGARGVTITGGLPYHGGPGSNYMTHSIAAMAERLRSDPGAYGMVSGVGMHMTKHVYGLWSTEPGVYSPPDLAALQAEVDRDLERAPLLETHDGDARVATYSVLHERDGSPSWGALVCELPDGARCYARLEDRAALESAESEEMIGRTVRLSSSGGVNRAALD